jgi:hypothetical protein
MFGAVAQSGNVPTMYNPIVCLDCSDTSVNNITESGGFVSLLKDRSGNGNDFTQGDVSKQPETNDQTINGLNVLYFYIGDYLSKASVVTATNLTIIAVLRTGLNNNVNASFFTADAADNDFQIQANTVGQYYGSVNSQNLGATTPPGLGSNQLGNVILTTYRFSATDSELTVRLNGVETGSDTYNGSMAASMTMRIAVNRALTSTQILNLAYLTVFNYDLPIAYIDTIETYLTDKWAVV